MALCPSVRHAPELYWNSKRLNESSSFLAWSYPSLILRCFNWKVKNLSQTPDLKISQLHVDCRMCYQLRWTLSVINWRRSSVASLSHRSNWASMHLCVQHYGCNAVRCAGLSVADETRRPTSRAQNAQRLNCKPIYRAYECPQYNKCPLWKCYDKYTLPYTTMKTVADPGF